MLISEILNKFAEFIFKSFQIQNLNRESKISKDKGLTKLSMWFVANHKVKIAYGDRNL